MIVRRKQMFYKVGPGMYKHRVGGGIFSDVLKNLAKKGLEALVDKGTKYIAGKVSDKSKNILNKLLGKGLATEGSGLKMLKI